MRKMWKMTGITAAMGIMAMTALTGCGGSSSADTTAKTSDGGAEVRTVKVGTGNAMPPYCSLNEDGKVEGYDVEVLKEVDNRLPQYEFDIQAMDFSTLIVSIDSNALDIVSHQLVQSTARKEKYLFPEQYYCLSPMCLAVKSDSGIKTMEDMGGKSMNQNPSSYEYGMLTAWNNQHKGSEINIIGVSDLTSADNFKQVSNGQVDAALTYSATYDKVQAELNLDNLECTDVVMVEDTYMMLGNDEEQLCKDVDAVLKEMLEDGTLSKISEEYLGQDIFTLYKDKITAVND